MISGTIRQLTLELLGPENAMALLITGKLFKIFDNFSRWLSGERSLSFGLLSEPEFYGDIVYEKIVGRTDFSAQFRKIMIHYVTNVLAIIEM